MAPSWTLPMGLEMSVDRYICSLLKKVKFVLLYGTRLYNVDLNNVCPQIIVALKFCMYQIMFTFIICVQF